MKIKSYIVNSFTTEIAQGNPAGVVILDKWLPDTLLINIAKDIGKSETAFIIKNGEYFNIRWFTPVKEMPICGHATMAAFKVINKIYSLNKVDFKSKSGVLSCFINESCLISMNFPMDNYEKVEIENEVLDHFNSNVTFMNWMKHNTGKTYREAVDQWYKIYKEKKSGIIRSISPQFEYNQYTRDFVSDNPGMSRKDCIRCCK